MTGNFIHDIIDEEIAEGKYSYGDIMTRFPPEPNGYIHIGHVKALYINFSTAEKYGGHVAAKQSGGIFTCAFEAKA